MKTNQLTTEDRAELYQLLQQHWGDRNGMADYCIKSSAYIKYGDKFLHVCDAKPSIDRTMWYDDETDGPAETLANFIRYNERNAQSPVALYHDGRTARLYITTHYYQDKTGGKLLAWTYEHEGDPRTENMTLATAEDVEAINAKIEEVRADYLKRLNMYFKKYGDKIHAQGYWANR